MEFAHPKILFALILIPLLTVWYVVKRKRGNASMRVSSAMPFASMPTSWRASLRHIVFALKMLALGCMIVVLSRPQTRDSWHDSSVEGTDIVLAIDISTSMLARDFDPNRLEAAKQVATQFISGRENDNMGLVIFAGESLTGVPLTSDRSTLLNYVQSINTDMLVDGTAIGDGLATSINRIKGGKAKSKSIILMTDGTNNTGVIAPRTAADVAASEGIRVYTIGIGSNGMAEFPVRDYFGRITYEKLPVVIDEVTLKDIAAKTNGKYFKADNDEALSRIFEEIDEMEKTTFDVKQFTHTEDNYQIWALVAFISLVLAAVLKQTVFRTIP